MSERPKTKEHRIEMSRRRVRRANRLVTMWGIGVRSRGTRSRSKRYPGAEIGTRELARRTVAL